MSGRVGMRKWIGWALCAYGVAAAALLLSPLNPSRVIDELMVFVHTTMGLPSVRQGWVEFGANVLLFVPVGLLVAMLFRRWWVGLFMSVALSAGVELVQMLLPARVASPRDVLANALGGAIGSLAALVVICVRNARTNRTPLLQDDADDS